MSNVKVPKEDNFTMDQTKTESWSTGISQYFSLDQNLQIKWLSTFATELTLQFRMIAQLESAASAPNEKLIVINEMFHQIFHSIAAKTLGLKVPYFDDTILFDYLQKNTDALGINMNSFFKRVEDVEDLKYCE